MATTSIKVYLVQRFEDNEGQRLGEVLAAKLTREAAQTIAKRYAPCKVVRMVADKSSEPCN